MVVVVIYRLVRKALILRRIARYRGFYVFLFFIVMWFLSTILFYYSERIVAGREDVDLWTAMYWSIITMATIGYGDVTPVKGLGWIVAGFTAIMGIIAYTLIISVVADWFLSTSLKRSMGLAPLKNKKVLVIGDSESCLEVIDELIINDLRDETGWVVPERPQIEPPVDFVVGDPRDQRTLSKAGVDKARYIILCFRDDSTALHVTLITRKYNKEAVYAAIVNTSSMEDLLREAGVKYVLSQRMLGRAIASAVFEPGVLTLLSDIVSARGKGDLVEHIAEKEYIGKTLVEYEKTLNEKDTKYKYRVVGLYRREKLLILPDPNTKIEENDRIILLKTVK